MIIRPATQQDWPAIKAILEAVDEYYATLSNEYFWAAEQDQQIIGVAQLKENNDYFFLSSLAVLPTAQGKRVASQLMEHFINKANKPIYLYTIIPDFFKRFGFKETNFTSNLPSRDNYECVDCHPDRCLCLVKKPQ